MSAPLAERLLEEGQPRVPEVLCLSSLSPESAVRAAMCAAARGLCLEYRDALVASAVPIDDFQHFTAEIANFPAGFAGAWLALLPANAPSALTTDAPVVHLGCRGAFAAVGVVALRDLGGGRAELKRLFVRPPARRLGAAAALTAAAAAAARAAGARELVLDTLGRLETSRLYERLGFAPIAPYNDNPMPDALFYGKTTL